MQCRWGVCHCRHMSVWYNPKGVSVSVQQGSKGNRLTLELCLAAGEVKLPAADSAPSAALVEEETLMVAPVKRVRPLSSRELQSPYTVPRTLQRHSWAQGEALAAEDPWPAWCLGKARVVPARNCMQAFQRSRHSAAQIRCGHEAECVIVQTWKQADCMAAGQDKLKTKGIQLK